MGMENGLIYATATTLRSFLNWTKESVIKSTNGVQSKDSVDCRSPYLLFHALQDEHPRAGRETSSSFFFFKANFFISKATLASPAVGTSCRGEQSQHATTVPPASK